MASPTDFIGDFLTIIRNASRARIERVTARSSRMAARIAEILKQEGFLENFKCFEEGNKQSIRLHLRYLRGRQPAIQGIRRVSRPGRRFYVNSQKIPRVRGGLGIAIVSTSKGLIKDGEARKARVGGELVCEVW